MADNENRNDALAALRRRLGGTSPPAEIDGVRWFLVGGAPRDAARGLAASDLDWMVVPERGAFDDFPAFMMDNFQFVNAESALPVFMIDGDEVALPRSEESSGAGHAAFDVEVLGGDRPVSEVVRRDLERRDLSFNALAFDPERGELFDPFGGLDDLRNGVVDPVSEAFADDPLRVLRLADFAARVDGEVSDEGRALARRVAPDVAELPGERLAIQLRKAFSKDSEVGRFFRVLAEVDALSVAFPEVANLGADAREELFAGFARARDVAGDDPMVMFGVLGNALGDADSRALARRLGLSNEELGAMLFGANHAGRLVRLDALAAEELIDLSGQFGEQGVLSPSQGGAVAAGAVAGADPRAVVGALRDALGSRESVGGREVMDANGLSPADIGGDDGPSGEEFGQLVREARADHFRTNRE